MSKPGAFLPPANFEQVSWKAGLPKKKELWLVQLPLSVRGNPLYTSIAAHPNEMSANLLFSFTFNHSPRLGVTL